MAGGKGSRGGKAGSSSLSQRQAISISFSDGTYLRYEKIGDTIYETSSSTPREVSSNATLDEMATRAAGIGGTVTKLTDADLQKIEQENAEYREAMNELLDQAYANDKHFVRGSRQNRTGNRAARRAR